MPNTISAKKAVRSSQRKREHNQMWLNRIKSMVKTIKKTILTKEFDLTVANEQLSVLQKTVDKAAKENVIHKNRANRLKSKYAQKIASTVSKSAVKDTAATKTKKSKAKSTKSK